MLDVGMLDLHLDSFSGFPPLKLQRNIKSLSKRREIFEGTLWLELPVVQKVFLK